MLTDGSQQLEGWAEGGMVAAAEPCHEQALNAAVLLLTSMKPADSMETAQAPLTAYLILLSYTNSDFCFPACRVVTPTPAEQQGPRSGLCDWDWGDAGGTNQQHEVGFL